MANAQFEKKLTFDFSLGYAIPVGEDLKDDRLPFFFSNLSTGLTFMADFQYNLDEHFAIGMMGEYTRFYSWEDPRVGSTSTNSASFINVINFNPYFRYRILKGKISPFVNGSMGVSMINGERSPSEFIIEDFFSAGTNSQFVSIDKVTFRERGEVLARQFRPNVMAGGGLDYNLSQSLGLFFDVTYTVIFTSGDEVLRQTIQYPTFRIGANVNFVKAKTL